MTGADTQHKLVRLIEEYGLEGLGADLERFWIADDAPNRSLRELAEYVNRELLRARLRETDHTPLANELDALYEALTDETASTGERLEARNRLELEGVDVDALLDDFVTYQAVRTYLTEVRDAEYRRETDETLDTHIETIERLRGRLLTVVEDRVTQLRDADRLTVGAFRVIVQVRVVCEDCGHRYEVTDLLRRGGCACGPAEG